MSDQPPELGWVSDDEVDYSWLGKVVLAQALYRNRERIEGFVPSDDPQEVSATVGISLRLTKRGAGKPGEMQPEICCICVMPGSGVVECRGSCCDVPH